MVYNKLSLNASKSQSLLLLTRKHDFMNSLFVNFLGIYIDPTLHWYQHTEMISRKFRTTIYLTRALINEDLCDILKLHMYVFIFLFCNSTYGQELFFRATPLQQRDFFLWKIGLSGCQQEHLMVVTVGTYSLVRESCFCQLCMCTIAQYMYIKMY